MIVKNIGTVFSSWKFVPKFEENIISLPWLNFYPLQGILAPGEVCAFVEWFTEEASWTFLKISWEMCEWREFYWMSNWREIYWFFSFSTQLLISYLLLHIFICLRYIYFCFCLLIFLRYEVVFTTNTVIKIMMTNSFLLFSHFFGRYSRKPRLQFLCALLPLI